VGYGQAVFGIAISPKPQAIEPLPESQADTSDNTSAQNVQEKILEQLDSLTEKRDRLKAAGDNIGAMVVSDQIKALEEQFDDLGQTTNTGKTQPLGVSEGVGHSY